MVSLRAQQSDQTEDEWLRRFHEGDRHCLETCYREHFETVARAVAFVASGADRETLVHEIFFRLLTDEPLRRLFRGGSFPAWLRVVARNQAIDYARRRRLEVTLPAEASLTAAPESTTAMERRIDVLRTLERFRAELCPSAWWAVFDARFVEHREQQEAARLLGVKRTTLAYREYRIRRLLRRFVLKGGAR